MWGRNIWESRRNKVQNYNNKHILDFTLNPQWYPTIIPNPSPRDPSGPLKLILEASWEPNSKQRVSENLRNASSSSFKRLFGSKPLTEVIPGRSWLWKTFWKGFGARWGCIFCLLDEGSYHRMCVRVPLPILKLGFCEFKGWRQCADSLGGGFSPIFWSNTL